MGMEFIFDDEPCSASYTEDDYLEDLRERYDNAAIDEIFAELDPFREESVIPAHAVMTNSPEANSW